MSKKIVGIVASIEPKWAELIFSGKKTVEVRKTVPISLFKQEKPHKVWVYETKNGGGTGMIIGEFTYSHTVPTLFDNFCKDACLTEEELNDYLRGRRGYGWRISNPRRYPVPVPISLLGFKHPPMSWSYVYERSENNV